MTCIKRLGLRQPFQLQRKLKKDKGEVLARMEYVNYSKGFHRKCEEQEITLGILPSRKTDAALLTGKASDPRKISLIQHNKKGMRKERQPVGSVRQYLPLLRATKWKALHRKTKDTNSSVKEWESAIKMRRLRA